MDTDSDSGRARLGPEIERRAVELDLRLQDVAERAKMTVGNLHKIRRGRISLTPLAKGRLERALEWPQGHIDQLIAAWDTDADKPLTVQQERLLDVYRNDYLPNHGREEAWELLRRDVDAINAAIEREQRDAG